MKYPLSVHTAALEHEKAFWRRTVASEAWRGEMQRNYREFAAHFEALLEKYVPPPHARVLQVGPAGRDGIHFMSPTLQRFAVDPLMPFYRGELGLPAEGVHEAGALAEALPIRDEACDGVACVNVLDHTWQPELVVTELRRVLRPGGLLFLGVDVHAAGQGGGAVDDIHLWRFEQAEIEARVCAAGFTLVERELHEHRKPKDARWFWLVATADESSPAGPRSQSVLA